MNYKKQENIEIPGINRWNNLRLIKIYAQQALKNAGCSNGRDLREWHLAS